MCLLICFRLLGICDSTVYDNRFVMTGTRNSKPYFRGYFRSHIYYTETGFWRMENIQVRREFIASENQNRM